ncbi:MAG: efflux RND transporter periplasmic adaptor subunit [Bacteroidales bacterium]|nr:efflux RND transporter periplasmic adaptor subunit [Bacteroidales bacterium]
MKLLTLNKAIFILMLAVTLTVSSCGDGLQVTETGEEAVAKGVIALSREQMKLSELTTGQLTDTLFSTMLPLTGYIDVPPVNRSFVGTYFAGRVVQIHVKTGQKLRKGDVILSLENPEFITMQQEYLEAFGRTALLKQDYERQQILAADNIASQKDLQTVTASYTAAMAMLNALRAKLALLQIDIDKLSPEKMTARIPLRAPINGMIAGIAVANGEWLSPETMAVELIDLSVLQLRLQVFEKDLPSLRMGQQVNINLPGNNPAVFTGVLRHISPQINMEKRSAELIVSINNPFPETLRPGMFVNAEVATAAAPVSCLPSSAVTEADDRFYVLMKTSEDTQSVLFRKVEVKTGMTYGGLTAVTFTEKIGSDAEFLLNGVFQLIQNEE